jgi:type I restriction enzyme S subunit
LKDINTSWDRVSPRVLFSERSTKSFSDDTHLTPSQIYGVLPQAEYMKITGNKVVLNLTGADNMKHVEENDFIIHLRSFQGGIEHSKFRGKVSNAYCVLTPNKKVEPRYFRWVLKSSGYIQELNSSTDQLRDGQSIKYEQFCNIALPLPTPETQVVIADFLDQRIPVIDELISKKNEILDQVGYYFDAKVRDMILGTGNSSVSPPRWASHIGSDRELIPLGRLVRIRGEKNDPIQLEQILSLTASRGVILYEDKGDIGNSASDDVSRYSIVRVNDLVVNCMNVIIGSVGISRYEGVLSPVYYVLMPISQKILNMEYLGLHFRIREFQRQLIRIGYGILDHRMRIPWVNLKSEKIVVPPIEVQNLIVGELKKLDADRFAALGKIEQSIKLLQEYKSSLISNAVIGRFLIDKDLKVA